MSDFFKDIQDYLPAPIVAAKIAFYDYRKGDVIDDEGRYNRCRDSLIDTALAVAGFFLAPKFANRFGLTLSQVGVVASMAFPRVVNLVTGSHCVAYGLQNALAATSLSGRIKFTALAIFGYLGMTEKMHHLLQQHVYRRIWS